MRRLRALRHGLLALLAAALLAMQGVGLQHRIEHGGTPAWIGQPQTMLASALRGFDPVHGAVPEADHHCAALDSHALADVPPAWIVSWCLGTAGVQEVAAHGAQPFIAARAQPFQARAPPFSLR